MGSKKLFKHLPGYFWATARNTHKNTKYVNPGILGLTVRSLVRPDGATYTLSKPLYKIAAALEGKGRLISMGSHLGDPMWRSC